MQAERPGTTEAEARAFVARVQRNAELEDERRRIEEQILAGNGDHLDDAGRARARVLHNIESMARAARLRLLDPDDGDDDDALSAIRSVMDGKRASVEESFIGELLRGVHFVVCFVTSPEWAHARVHDFEIGEYPDAALAMITMPQIENTFPDHAAMLRSRRGAQDLGNLVRLWANRGTGRDTWMAAADVLSTCGIERRWEAVAKAWERHGKPAVAPGTERGVTRAEREGLIRCEFCRALLFPHEMRHHICNL